MAESGPNFEGYWQLRVDGATARLKAAQQIIAHNPTRGNLAENLLREVIREFLPHRYAAGTGFVVSDDGKRSRQIDILLYDQLNDAAVFRDGELVVLSPSCVRVAIEVKSQLTGDEVKASYSNIASARSLNPEIYGIVFGYDGCTAPTMIEHIQSIAPPLPLKNWPDQAFNLERNFLIEPEFDIGKRTCDERRFKLVEGIDPVVRMFLTSTLTALKVRNLRAFFVKDRVKETPHDF